MKQEREPERIVCYDNYHTQLVPGLHAVLNEAAQSNETYIEHLYWFPNPCVTDLLVHFCRSRSLQQVLEVGPGVSPFPLTTTFVGWNETGVVADYVSVNMNRDPLPFENRHFDFVYARHFLEDVENPAWAMAEMIRCSRSGYVETPAPMIEIMRGVDAPGKNSHLYCGYSHHHSIIWGDMRTNTLFILPKKNNLLENMQYDPQMKQAICYVANRFPVYWNQYFLWTEPPQIVVYSEEDCCPENYIILLNRAIVGAMNNTCYFLEKMTPKN